jgi:flagellar protein FliS
MTDAANANAYLRTRVMTARPEELRLLLLEGAVKFALQAKDGLAASDHEAAFAGFSQCRNIVLELLTTIRPEHDPVLAERVKALYTWLYSELVAASFDRDAAKLEKVIELLEYERQTWEMLLRKLAEERNAGGPAATPAADAQPKPDRPRLSISA